MMRFVYLIRLQLVLNKQKVPGARHLVLQHYVPDPGKNGKEMKAKNEGPDCVDGKGKVTEPIKTKPEAAPVSAVREC